MWTHFILTCTHPSVLELLKPHLNSLGLIWAHLNSFGLTWIHLDSPRRAGVLEPTWTHLSSLGLMWSHLNLLGLTTHVNSLDFLKFNWAHVDSFELTRHHWAGTSPRNTMGNGSGSPSHLLRNSTLQPDRAYARAYEPKKCPSWTRPQPPTYIYIYIYTYQCFIMDDCIDICLFKMMLLSGSYWCGSHDGHRHVMLLCVRLNQLADVHWSIDSFDMPDVSMQGDPLQGAHPACMLDATVRTVATTSYYCSL